MSPSFPGLASSDPFQRFLLSQSLEIMDDLAAIIDLEGRVTYANPAAGRLLGCRQEHLAGRFLWDIVPDSARIAEMMQTALEMGQWRGEVSCSTQGGESIPVRLRAVLIQTKEGEILGVVVLGWDLRPEKQMEGQLVRHERQRLLGEMASGMAHNFNNILVGIHGHAQILAQDPGLSESGRRSADIVVESAERAAELVDRLQRSARGDPDSPETAVDLDDLIRSCVVATEPRWRDMPASRGQAIQMDLELNAGQSIDARRSSVDEVLTNFIFNAVDAMPEGGRVSIRTWSEGDSVCFSVADTGTGMDSQTRQRLGELFFTTKGERWHGLGLAFCYRIVDQMRGVIQVESASDKGTTFTVRLPAGRKAVLVDSDRELEGRPPKKYNLSTRPRVLVVEDDEQIRQLVASALQEFDVETAGDGQEGLVKFRNQSFDIAILDLSIPGPNGAELAKIIKEDSDIPLILMTGWDPEDATQTGLFDRVILKPFTLEEFRKQVIEVLA